MRYLKMDGPYNDYGRPKMWDKYSSVKCVVDTHIRGNLETDPNKQVMLLIEPRSIQPDVYEKAVEVADRYKYVFTHDSKLLNTLPNAKPIIWGGVWCRCENPKKTKLISMVSSDKEMCVLHKARKEFARKYKDKIDVYGTVDGGTFTDPIDTLENYVFSIVIENYIDDLWFTEKILNCFATYTIPIYLGARNIGDYFDTSKFIQCSNIHEIEDFIYTANKFDYKDIFLEDWEKKVKPSLKDNYELSKKYENFEEWFYKEYGNEIERMFD